MSKIPKVIHYIWLGGNMPQKVQKVIDNNRHYFAEYQVKLWTEENMPELNAFAKRAYDEEQWAFVSDYLRFYILHKEGGIYLDTDMEVLRSLDPLLEYTFFSGWDRRKMYIYAGIIGSEAEHDYLKSILRAYDKIEEGYPTSPQIMTTMYEAYKKKETLKIFESPYFYPLLDGEKRSKEKLKNAYTDHLWFESWRSFVPLRQFLRRIGFVKLYHKFLTKGKK